MSALQNTVYDEGSESAWLVTAYLGCFFLL